MRDSKEILDFWEKAKKATRIKGSFQDAYGFGDNPRLMDELLTLILTGKKTATTTLVREMELEGSPEPKLGEYCIILDGSEKPRAIIQTLSVRRVRFCEVDKEHAHWEGEGNRTLESYRRDHVEYYRRRGKVLGFTFSEKMEVLLERFKLVYPLRTAHEF
jgi:uncharacterized protein YhfF